MSMFDRARGLSSDSSKVVSKKLHHTRRGLLASACGLLAGSTLAAATIVTPVRERGVPADLAEACKAYSLAVEVVIEAAAENAAEEIYEPLDEAAEQAERRMIDIMRKHCIHAAVVEGRLYVNSWEWSGTPEQGCVAGAAVISMDNVRGL